MTKQEISEIKKLFTPKNCSITRIADAMWWRKKIKNKLNRPFWHSEEMFNI